MLKKQRRWNAVGILITVMLVFSSVSTAAYAAPLYTEVSEEQITEEEEGVDEAGGEELALEEADEAEEAVTAEAVETEEETEEEVSAAEESVEGEISAVQGAVTEEAEEIIDQLRHLLTFPESFCLLHQDAPGVADLQRRHDDRNT